MNRVASLVACLDEIDDPRIERTRVHSLSDILVLSVLAVIAGADGWEDIEEFGKQKRSWLKKFLKLRGGITSHDTISRVFRMLKPSAFQKAFGEWVIGLHEELGFRTIAIDGKSLGRSHDCGSMKRMLHSVCAWSVVQVINVTERDGKETNEVRYYISSFPLGVRKAAGAIRNHWGIENSLHWVLDMTFNEDQSRIRKDHGAENFALLRRFAISLIRQDTSNGSIRKRRKRAAWNEDFLLNLIPPTT